MRSGMKMKVWEAEEFLNQTSDVARSLADPWILDQVQDRDVEGKPLGTYHDLPFDPQVLLQTILFKAGELGIVFNNVATYYKMDKFWWDKWKPTFQRWWEVEEMWYNPMWDKDGYHKAHNDVDDAGHSDTTTQDDGTDNTVYGETWSESGNDDRDIDFTTDREGHETQLGKETVNVHDGKSDTYSKSHSKDTNSVSAYDAATAQLHDIQEHQAGLDGNGDSVLNTYSSTTDTTFDGRDTKSTEKTVNPDHTDNTGEYSKEGAKDSTTDRTTHNEGTVNVLDGNNRDIDESSHDWGQQGISTKSQEMYGLEYRRRYQYNPYELMTQIFMKEMTDGIWI